MGSAVHEAQEVIRAQRIDLGTRFQTVANAQAARANILARPLFGDLLIIDLAIGQIDPRHTIGISSKRHVLCSSFMRLLRNAKRLIVEGVHDLRPLLMTIG